MPEVFRNAEVAACALRILALLAVVTYVAYLAQSLDVWLAGTIGSCLGLLLDIPPIQETGVTFLGRIAQSADHVLFWGMLGATVGCLVAWMLSNRPKQRFSLLHTAILLVAVLSLLGLFLYF